MWKTAGHNVCRDAFTVLLGIGNWRLLKIMRSMRTSGMCPYSHQRSSHGGNLRHSDVRLGVEACWHFCYHHIAEPLAYSDPKALGEEVGSGARVLEYVAGTNGKPLAGATLDLYHTANKKYMPPMSWPEVYIMYCNIAVATSEMGELRLVQKGVRAV